MNIKIQKAKQLDQQINRSYLQTMRRTFIDRIRESRDKSTRVTFQDLDLDFQLHFEDNQLIIGSFLQKRSSKTRLEFGSAIDVGIRQAK